MNEEDAKTLRFCERCTAGKYSKSGLARIKAFILLLTIALSLLCAVSLLVPEFKNRHGVCSLLSFAESPLARSLRCTEHHFLFMSFQNICENLQHTLGYQVFGELYH